MDNHIKQKLDFLNGKTFKLGKWDIINKKNFNATHYKIGPSNTLIFTKERTFNLLNSEVERFLKSIDISMKMVAEFNPKQQKKIKQETLPAEKVDLNVFEPSESQKKTQEALSDMLDKVLSGEKEAIPQAKAVCDIANAMVNMEKSQIALMQIATKINRK